VNLRAAAERVVDATPAERRAMLVDLQHERAEIVYAVEHTKARIAVLDALLRAWPRMTPR
jgi:hypothetical protein